MTLLTGHGKDPPICRERDCRDGDKLLCNKPPYCYCCTPITPILLLLCPYIIIFRSDRITLWPHGLLYIERSFFHLYHPIIFHSCNVLKVSPSKWLISKVFISLFFYFWRWFHNKIMWGFGRRSLDSSLPNTNRRDQKESSCLRQEYPYLEIVRHN